MKKTVLLTICFLVMAVSVAWYSAGINIDATGGKIRLTAANETMYYDLYYDADNDRLVIESSDIDGAGTDGAVIAVADGTGQVYIPNAVETVGALGAALSGTVSIDVSAAKYYHGTMTGGTEFSFTGWPATGLSAVEIELVNPGASALTVDCTWAGGTAPTYTASGTDIFRFFSRDAGTTVHGETIALDVQ